MCNHDESDILFPGVCVSCEWDSPTDILARAGKFMYENAAWIVISASAVIFAVNIYWWWNLGFEVIGK